MINKNYKEKNVKVSYIPIILGEWSSNDMKASYTLNPKNNVQSKGIFLIHISISQRDMYMPKLVIKKRNIFLTKRQIKLLGCTLINKESNYIKINC